MFCWPEGEILHPHCGHTINVLLVLRFSFDCNGGVIEEEEDVRTLGT